MRRTVVALLLFAGVLLVNAGIGHSAEIITKSGFRIEGRLGKVSGLASNPLKPDAEGGAVSNRLIVLADDGLRRTFVCTYQVREALESEPLAMTRIKIDQRIAVGRARRIGMVGPIIHVDRWDPFGRRKFTMQTNRGPLTVIQGITEVTPVWTKVQGLQSGTPYQWDMRIATTSIPRETLSAVLMNQIDKDDIDQRRQIVKLYIESDRYRDAGRELEGMFTDFPDLRKEMTDLARDLRQMSARRLMKEIELRQDAGQHRLALQMLQGFPNEGVAGIILGEVAEKEAEYETTFAKAKSLLAKLDENVELVKDDDLRRRIEPIQEEIHSELNIHNMDRFGDFLRLADAERLQPEQKVSLAISNWLMGGEGIENLAVSLSIYNTRNLTRQYLASTRRDQRAKLLEAIATGRRSDASLCGEADRPYETAAPCRQHGGKSRTRPGARRRRTPATAGPAQHSGPYGADRTRFHRHG